MCNLCPFYYALAFDTEELHILDPSAAFRFQHCIFGGLGGLSRTKGWRSLRGADTGRKAGLSTGHGLIFGYILHFSGFLSHWLSLVSQASHFTERSAAAASGTNSFWIILWLSHEGCRFRAHRTFTDWFLPIWTFTDWDIYCHWLHQNGRVGQFPL